MRKNEKLKVFREQRAQLNRWIVSLDIAIAKLEMPDAKPAKADNLDFSKKERYGQIIESVASALYGRKKYAIHYKKLAERLELDPDQVAVALFTLKERGEVVRVRRGYYRGA